MKYLNVLILCAALVSLMGCAEEDAETCVAPEGIYRFAASDLGGSCPQEFVGALLGSWDAPEREFQELNEAECGSVTDLPPPDEETSSDGACVFRQEFDSAEITSQQRNAEFTITVEDAFGRSCSENCSHRFLFTFRR